MNHNYRRYNFSKQAILQTTTSPGVYLYWRDESNTPMYVGKAKNLKNRLKSYITVNLYGKTKKMVSEIKYFSYIVVNSEIEALILEANLVKKYKPFYNIELKDDKHPLYVVITKDEYPRILTVRKSDSRQYDKVYGPFPSSTILKTALKTLRRSFKYSDHLPTNRQCLYSQINLCNPCPSYINLQNGLEKDVLKQDYLKNIKILKKIFGGNIQKVILELEKEIKSYSQNENFEEALKARDKLKSLKYITENNDIDEYLENPNFLEDLRKNETKLLQKILEIKGGIKLKKLKRIECFDIAHLSGNFTTASMVTFIDGNANKDYYRHFKINSTKKSSDVDSLSEVINRRIGHLKDWGVPDLIVVDGGKGQVRRFSEVLKKFEIPVVGLAKREESLVFMDKDNKFSMYKLPNNQAKNLLQRMRDEAHRFARRYHHQLLRKSFIASSN